MLSTRLKRGSIMSQFNKVSSEHNRYSPLKASDDNRKYFATVSGVEVKSNLDALLTSVHSVQLSRLFLSLECSHGQIVGCP